MKHRIPFALLGLKLVGCDYHDGSTFTMERSLELTIEGTHCECDGELVVYPTSTTQAASDELILQVGLDCLGGSASFGFDIAYERANALNFFEGQFEPAPSTYSITLVDIDGAQHSKTVAARAILDPEGQFQVELRLSDSDGDIGAATRGRWPNISCRTWVGPQETDWAVDSEFDTAFCRHALEVLRVERFPSIRP